MESLFQGWVCVDSPNGLEKRNNNFPWEDPDYESAWRILEQEYGGEERFVSHQWP